MKLNVEGQRKKRSIKVTKYQKETPNIPKSTNNIIQNKKNEVVYLLEEIAKVENIIISFQNRNKLDKRKLDSTKRKISR